MPFCKVRRPAARRHGRHGTRPTGATRGASSRSWRCGTRPWPSGAGATATAVSTTHSWPSAHRRSGSWATSSGGSDQEHRLERPFGYCLGVAPATPLHDVTFVVVDLETTGMSPAADAIAEVGAIKLRAGECLGTFQTMVRPDVGIPAAITSLTGITEAMVAPAPSIEAVLPSFLEFA